MNILLIYPKTGMDFGSTVAPPHALLAIAAPLIDEGYQVNILDQRIESIQGLVIKNSTVCGVSCMTGTQIKHALEIAQQIRSANPDIPIVFGGCHPTIMPEQTLFHPNVDYVLAGEGESGFLSLVKALENGESPARIVRGEEIDVEQLLPTPWHLVNVEKYIHPDMYLKGLRVLDIGQTSRGCPFKCGFCSSASIRGRRWRPMSVGKSVGIIKDAVLRFNLDGIWLRDDEFYIDRSRAHAICEAIAPLGIRFYTSGTRVDVFNRATPEQIKMLKMAGAHTLKFGAESGSQKTLDRMKKGIKVGGTLDTARKCREHGITPVYSIIIGYMGESFSDIDKTIDLMKQIKRINSQAKFETMAIYTPLPGTPDWATALEMGLRAPEKLEDWEDWLFDDYDLDGVRSPWYSKKERLWLGNISYMSMLGNALVNVAGSIHNRFLRKVSQVLAIPLSAFYRWRLYNKWYRFAPDLYLVRWLRRKIMY